MRAPIFPYGHFYSPIVDTEDVQRRADRIWSPRESLHGIDFNLGKHLEILRNWFPEFIAEYDYPDAGDSQNPAGFFSLNDQFSWLDARMLYVLLRKMRPTNIIEVGSGFSSLLIADVASRHLNAQCNFTCIEPYPREFLTRGVPGISRLITERVENLDLTEFSRLQGGDILFIDSSHVAKTGSDVVFLFFEVLPLLKPGVFVHILDIFLPSEYPQEWVIDQNRSWNEQYLLQALLTFSTRFRVIFGSAYAATHHGNAVVAALARPDGHGMGGGSFWIEVQ